MTTEESFSGMQRTGGAPTRGGGAKLDAIWRMCAVAIMAAFAAGSKPLDGPRPWTHLNYQNDPDDFQFAIVPDRTGGDYRGAFTNALDKVNRMHPEFVITIGDLVDGMTMQDVNARRSVGEVHRVQQVELTNMTAKVSAPFFTVVGNHDINRSRPYPACFTKANEESTAVWKEFYGDDTYYSFIYKNVLFVCLNTMDGRVAGNKQVGIADRQYSWFKKTLDAHADVRWTMVFMHQPTEWLTEAWFKFEQEELTKRPYTVFAGDWHTYLHARRHGRDYYVLSVAGGGSCMNARKSGKERTQLKGPAYGEMDHITWVTMTPKGPDVVNLLLDGILPGDYLNQRNTLCSKYSDALDYPPDPEAVAHLAKFKAQNDAAANVRTVKASSFGWNAQDATAALQAAIDSGAGRVIVDWQEEGDWRIAPVLLRTSNQEIAIADGVTLRAKDGLPRSLSASLLTIPAGVTNVFLYGIVTATIAADGGDPKHAISILGGKDISVRDLTLVTDGGEGVNIDGAAANVRIEGIERLTFRDWRKRE